jgi:hypothetical protein
MILTKQNYLEIHVGISTRAKWYLELQKKMNRLNVECKKSRFHITALFMNDDALKNEIIEAFDRTFDHRYDPHLTFNKLEAFTSKSGKKHIVNLTSTQPEVGFRQLVESLRDCAIKVGAHIEDYRLHVTTVKVPVNIISLEDLQKLIAGINLPEFTLVLKTIEFRYKMCDLEKGYITGWKYDETNNRFIKKRKNV